MGLLQTYKQPPMFVSDHVCEADVQRQDLSCMYLAHHELDSVVESSKQASKQASERASEQASKQASKQANSKQVSEQASKQTSEQALHQPINLHVLFLELIRRYAENAELK